MKYQADQNLVTNTVFFSDGTIQFNFDGETYKTTDQPYLGNNMFVANLTRISDIEYPSDVIGEIRWNILDHGCDDDDSNACNWEVFDVYF